MIGGFPCNDLLIRVYTMMRMLRALWLVIAHDLLEYRHVDAVTGNFFSLFCSTWRAFLKIFVILLRIKSESLEKSVAGAIYKEENGELETKRVLDNLRMPKLQEIFTTVAIVCHRWNPLFCKLFLHYSALSNKRRWKTFRKELYTKKIMKKRKSRDEK